MHINGSNDLILRSTSSKSETLNEDTNRSNNTISHVIEGGNHAGFAHYGPQMFPRPDGDRTITLEDQQKITVNLAADFLLDN